MAETPHFAVPFRAVGGRFAVNEQDTLDDVADCVEAALLTRVGERAEHPDYGTSDLTFQQRPLNLDALVREVETWEPRAHLLAEERPDLLDEAVTRASLTLSLEED